MGQKVPVPGIRSFKCVSKVPMFVLKTFQVDSALSPFFPKIFLLVHQVHNMLLQKRPIIYRKIRGICKTAQGQWNSLSILKCFPFGP